MPASSCAHHSHPRRRRSGSASKRDPPLWRALQADCQSPTEDGPPLSRDTRSPKAVQGSRRHPCRPPERVDFRLCTRAIGYAAWAGSSVKVLDANLLIYVYDLTSPYNARATNWFEALLSSPEPIGIPLLSIAAFLRVMTDRRLPIRMLPDAAVSIVEEWLALPHVRLPLPGPRHWTILRTLIADGQITGKLLTDAQIAAIALEYGGEVQTTDRDFARLSSVRSANPLARS